MNEVIERYFDAWNNHDADALIATFAPGGTYEDPNTGGPLSGTAIGAYAGAAFGIYPDVSFETTGAHAAGDGLVATQWVMRGTNTGPLPGGMPPTGKAIEVAGADFITYGDDGVHSVRGYFSPGDSMRQIGMDVIVQPKALGPFEFGTSTHVSGKGTAEPGAVGMTWIKTRDEADMEAVRAGGRATVMEMADAKGFIGVTTGNVQGHLFTAAMWETVEDMQAAMRGPAHVAAMQSMRDGVGVSMFTSVWKPDYLNMMMVRCPDCAIMNQAQPAGGTCKCGSALPAHPSYW